jgi:hypothetical protein
MLQLQTAFLRPAVDPTAHAAATGQVQSKLQIQETVLLETCKLSQAESTTLTCVPEKSFFCNSQGIHFCTGDQNTVFKHRPLAYAAAQQHIMAAQK